MKKRKIGVVHGRFQPFHIGHLDYVMMALKNSDFLYIGIANPDPSLTKSHKANSKRAKTTSNPFTYYERLSMIKNTLISKGINQSEFEIVPFPINFPQYIKYYVPIKSTFFITIYDDWGYAKKETLENNGFTVKVLEEGNIDLKLAEGTEIRELMKKNKNWREFVPNLVAEYITNNNLVEQRILKKD
ncbi:MAG TPA: nicotinate-nucleotide adenylyltransferase [Bacteroidia bacterium]|nr:nicotinate-nucleotide adenylyltransferase [Bacteroidia bacterium]